MVDFHVHPPKEIQTLVQRQTGSRADLPATRKHEIYGALQEKIHNPSRETQATREECRRVLPSAVERKRVVHQTGSDKAGCVLA
jgi:hypothetical protein